MDWTFCLVKSLNAISIYSYITSQSIDYFTLLCSSASEAKKWIKLGRPKWVTALNPVKRDLPAIFWKCCSHIYYKTNQVTTAEFELSVGWKRTSIVVRRSNFCGNWVMKMWVLRTPFTSLFSTSWMMSVSHSYCFWSRVTQMK